MAGVETREPVSRKEKPIEPGRWSENAVYFLTPVKAHQQLKHTADAPALRMK
jgi:hypothetical protein